ncbi:hydrolase [Uliginosibacterium paludis]|uniref:Hydrolase n=1 Tax=Uliginosibacterium paludis TaxID=1615952 RepID=A0ABV2CKK2_9RHOO
MIELDPARTALVLIDLQHGILGMPRAPYDADTVLSSCKVLAARCREAGAFVVQVHVGWSDDRKDAPTQPVDQPAPVPPGGLPANWSDFVDGVVQPGDHVILKRHWGAFYGTDLDLQLRRRGIDTLVLGGVATNFGVESTARQAWEMGYRVVVAEDACTSTSAALHEMSVTAILPRIARVAKLATLGFAG